MDLVYFIQGEVLRHVKIGYSTKSALIQRLKAHQTGSPDKLILLGIALGTRKHEAELHQRFKASRLHGEWFQFSNELEQYIKENCLVLNNRQVMGLKYNAACETTFAINEYFKNPVSMKYLNSINLTEWYIKELFSIFEHLSKKNS
ncbi:GIY-YIG nuclease family protein [Vibrio cholerae]|nr:GIY-YIG nuclease family protein [Vibrio cholerae]EJL6670152.1 GIY-YIG nuclease family protein [Vibrio cholerae]EJL6953723.1 GIY-YIG nuclease family protein [Vibrio cholerae]EKF9373244.1 GIY-YIG nuclease family protein [Vibrio cholerae]EKF9821331.1 GIY-YIG nuclease family protein [Vibrio cholerae]